MTRDHPVDIKDSLMYCQRIFATGDILPKHGNDQRKLFKIVVFYFIQLAMLQLWDLYDVLHDFNALIEVATELPLTLSILFGLVLIGTNKKLIVVVERIQSDVKGALLFENDEEKRAYQKYNNISFYFGKYISMFAFFISYFLYATPLIDLLIHSRAAQDNNTRPYVLPFRSHMFFDYRYDTKVYTLIYLYQLPVAFLGVYHAAEVSLIVTSTLHICAKMSMLASRIRKSLTKYPVHFRQRMRTMVMEHLELTKLTNFLNNCFHHILLVEYLNCSFRLAITMYVVLITLRKDMMAAINYILYTIIVAAWLYLYSYIGEQLVHESQEVGEAFYNTDWTDITSQDRRSLVICLINGQKPQYLMAGKFYRFTLFGFSDSDHHVEIKDSLMYCQRIFAIGGVLPLHDSTALFKIVVFYFIQLAILQLWDLFDVLHDFDAIIENMSVLPLTITIPFALVLIRTNKKLLVVIKKIRRDINGAILFENDEEKRLYQKYNNISFYFSKYVSMFTLVNTYLLYVRPLIGLVVYSLADHGNNTRSYELPFRSHTFFDYHYDLKLYTLLYFYQLPAGFAGLYHAAEASLIVTSTLHVCGKLSMLAYRIRMSLTKSPTHFRRRMKTMVTEHLELMELTDFLNDCFHHILLLEYLNCSFRLSITMYVVLVTFGRDTVAAINFILYSIIVAAWLYLYSYIGEQLAQESQEVGEAFYNTVWTEITNQDKKSLIICLLNGQKPQYLMFGKFYRFTLFGFTDIVKTSMAFLSVLRARVA